MDAETLAQVAHLPGVRGVRMIGLGPVTEPSDGVGGPFHRAWSLAASRASALGHQPLEACEVTARAGRLVMVRVGDRVACALVAGHPPTSVLRYELREALEGSEATHADAV